MSRPAGAGRTTSPLDLQAVADGAAEAIAGLGADAGLLWAATPTALLDHPRAATGPRPGRGAVRRAAGTLAAAARPGRGGTFVRVGPVLFAYEGANPAGTLGPVIDALAGALATTPARVTVRPPLRALRRGLRELDTVRAALVASVGDPVPPSFEAALQAGVRARARATVALGAARPALVVVASQHSTASRAVLQGARALGVPTAYLPHAPVADTYQYRDLPTDLAALRGAREVDFYRALGVTGALAVAGNPQVEVRPPRNLDPGLPVVFAPRPLAPEVVEAQVQGLAAVADHVIVSPHPRMRSQVYGDLWPRHWAVHAGATVELLQRGHPCVVQVSSGVAWEAMAHGVPVVELAQPSGGPPLYPLIQAPHAQLCAVPGDLPAAVAEALGRAGDPAARAEQMAWAGEWCHPTGREAVKAAVACTEGWLAADGDWANAPLLDHWAPPGAAR